MKARFYDPDVGRFLNQDTYLGENGTPPSLHRYLYAYSNPAYYIDPTGNFAVTDWLNKQFKAEGDAVRAWADKVHNSDSNGTVKAIKGAGAKLLAGLDDTAAMVFGAADEAVDAGLSAFGDREILGQNSYQRTNQRLDKTANIARKAADATSAYLTDEDLGGRIVSDVEKAAQKTAEFGGKLVDGDSRAWSSAYAGVASLASGAALAKLSKVGGGNRSSGGTGNVDAPNTEARTGNGQANAAQHEKLKEQYQKLDPNYTPLSNKKIAGNNEPKNFPLANSVHPETGVRFTPDGYADFSPHSAKTVKIKQTGNNDVDFRNANIEAGYGSGARSHVKKVPGHTWHHHQNGIDMELVKTDPIHKGTGHSGGAEIAKKSGGANQ